MQAYKKSISSIGGRAQRGITLIELLIVVVIIAIIASVAYPSYTDFIVRAKRTAAKSMILQVTNLQEQYFADNKQYATTLTALGFATSPFAINEDGTVVATTATDRLYVIALALPTATSYTVGAVPQLGQLTRDTDCGSLWMTNAGTKGQTGSGDKCW